MFSLTSNNIILHFTDFKKELFFFWLKNYIIFHEVKVPLGAYLGSSFSGINDCCVEGIRLSLVLQALAYEKQECAWGRCREKICKTWRISYILHVNHFEFRIWISTLFLVIDMKMGYLIHEPQLWKLNYCIANTVSVSLNFILFWRSI